jgi:histone acetyltransferase (RNA polymerase elongator complex component)
MIVPIFLPHLGCQNRCIYCDQDAITDVNARGLKSRIEEILTFRKDPFEVGLYGGNIFNIKPEALRRLFSYFDNYRAVIKNFRISTKPVPLDDEVIAILIENRVTTIELGIPSFNDHILDFLNRKHTSADLTKAFKLLTGEGLQVALQVMVGLPHETMEDIRETVAKIVSLKPAYIRIYPLAFIDGTPLADMFKAQKFVPITFDKVIHRAMLIYLNALQHEIKTVKMGLTDNEVIKEKIIGGYYHPAFGFLVKSEAFFHAVMAKIAATGFSGEVTVSLNNRDITHLLGHKRSNIIRFNEAGLSITWQVNDIPTGTFQLKSGGQEIEGAIFDALSGEWDQQMTHN